MFFKKDKRRDSAHGASANTSRSSSTTKSIQSMSGSTVYSAGSRAMSIASASSSGDQDVPLKKMKARPVSRFIAAPTRTTLMLETLASRLLEHLATSARYGYPLSSNHRVWRRAMRNPELQASYSEFLKALWANGELFAGLLGRAVEDGWSRLDRLRLARARIRELVSAVQMAGVTIFAVAQEELRAERERAKAVLREELKAEKDAMLRDVDVLADMLSRFTELMPLVSKGIDKMEAYRDGDISSKIVEPDRKAYKGVVHDIIMVWRRLRSEVTALRSAVGGAGDDFPVLKPLGDEDESGEQEQPEMGMELLMEEELTEAWRLADLGGTPRKPFGIGRLAPGASSLSKRISFFPTTAEERPFDAILKGWAGWCLDEWYKASNAELCLESNFGDLMEEALRVEAKESSFRRYLRKDSKRSERTPSSSSMNSGSNAGSPQLRPVAETESPPPEVEPVPCAPAEEAPPRPKVRWSTAIVSQSN